MRVRCCDGVQRTSWWKESTEQEVAGVTQNAWPWVGFVKKEADLAMTNRPAPLDL